MRLAKTKFDKEITYCNDEYVAVRLMTDVDKENEISIGGIILPGTHQENGRLFQAQILKVGKVAHEKYGIEEGDYVFIDFLATYGHSYPIATLKYDSVIYKTNVDATEFYPLKDMCFVEATKTEDVTNLNGIYVPNYSERLMTGKIIKKNFDDDSINIGDTIILTKGSDNVKIGNRSIKIYKKDMIVAVVKDDE